MNVGQIFLPEWYSYSEQRLIQRLPDPISPKAATEATPFVLYEAPIVSPWFVVFFLKPNPGLGEFGATIMDISHIVQESDLKDSGLVLTGKLWTPGLPEHEKLIGNAAQEMQPLLDQKAPFAEMASVWANQPTVYRTFIDKRKNPGQINRENSYIILSWQAWEQAGLSLKERVAKMHSDGFGDLTPTNLQKRAERLELSSKIDDKPKKFVVRDFLAPDRVRII